MATGTVPAGTPASQNNKDTPLQIGPNFGAVPGKPSAVTGTGGPSISIPKVGKAGK